MHISYASILYMLRYTHSRIIYTYILLKYVLCQNFNYDRMLYMLAYDILQLIEYYSSCKLCL